MSGRALLKIKKIAILGVPKRIFGHWKYHFVKLREKKKKKTHPIAC